jgi:hypothetical protein
MKTVRKSVSILLALIIAAILICTVPVITNAAGETADVNNGIPVFNITIDETAAGYGTIEQMNSSPDHSAECTGKINVEVPDGYKGDYSDAALSGTEDLELEYIRGRGHTTWLENKKLVSSFTVKKSQFLPASVCIYTKKAGKTTLTIYEKRGKAKKKKIGTIKLTVKRVKDAEVFWSNFGLDNNGIFYERFISPGQSFDLKAIVERRYINHEWTGSHFDEDEYKFEAVSNHPEIISVDKDGICTCNALDEESVNYVTYKVTFKDGSTASRGGSFDVWPEDAP